MLAGHALFETHGIGSHVLLFPETVQVKFFGHLPHLSRPPQPLSCMCGVWGAGVGLVGGGGASAHD